MTAADLRALTADLRALTAQFSLTKATRDALRQAAEEIERLDRQSVDQAAADRAGYERGVREAAEVVRRSSVYVPSSGGEPVRYVMQGMINAILALLEKHDV